MTGNLEAEIRWWVDQGYSARAIGLMYQWSENTARRKCYGLGINRFGDKDIPAAWAKRLLKKPVVPPNLENLHKRLLWHLHACHDINIDLLRQLLPTMNEQRLADWWWLEQSKRVTKLKLLTWRNEKLSNR